VVLDEKPGFSGETSVRAPKPGFGDFREFCITCYCDSETTSLATKTPENPEMTA
jgi:hypothetical protein